MGRYVGIDAEAGVVVVLIGSLVKTQAGQLELTERALGLSLKARRVLIMLDGSRRLAHLQPHFDVPLHSAVQDLMTLGLVGFAPVKPGPASPTHFCINADAPPHVARGQIYLMGVANNLFGDEPTHLTMQIGAAADPAELRKALLLLLDHLRGLASPALLQEITKGYQVETAV